MQGKLVEQDPNDESVEVLLEKIRAEKQKLFEEGKIKKKDLDISIVSQGDDNSYYGNKDETTSYPIYEIPEAWRYIKFASLVNFRIGKLLHAVKLLFGELKYLGYLYQICLYLVM
ncbi:restriction endonuclease S subunit [Streptococcus pneumoniae]|nr:restriction endonuclease S subunit [Streptococcus pneumoniae]VTE29514.1 restriction endonuclease S subunit [Streptococcus pneumoniae]